MNEQLLHDKAAFEAYLAETMEAIVAPDTLKQAMSYSLLADGKKLRPLFAIATARTLGLATELVFPWAAAIEMVHTYSLIHDDLPAMDDDDLRRGRPTNHVVYGEALAILAGDALLTQSFAAVLATDAEAATKIELVQLLSEAAGSDGMIAGQVLDIAAEGMVLSAAELTAMHQKKTGCLLAAPILGAAKIAAVPEPVYRLLERFGACIGLAFQIQDDILDVVSTSEALGKSASDAANDKSTYVSILGLEASRQKCNDLMQEAKALLAQLDYPAMYLLSLVEAMASRQK